MTSRLHKRPLLLLALAVLAPASCYAKIVIKGSDTLGAKLVPQLAESFKSIHRGLQVDTTIEIAAEGSATGIASVIDGTADIAMLSRALSVSEITEANARGRQLQLIEVARDALVVIAHRENPRHSLTLSELNEIFSGDVQNWAALSDLPEPISAYTRNTSSGTYVAFRQLALRHRDYSKRIQKMASNEQIANEVAGTLGGIGYVGLAYANHPETQVLRIDNQLPTEANYPLARPLYFLVDASNGASKQKRAFIDYTLSEEGQMLVASLDFLPASSDE